MNPYTREQATRFAWIQKLKSKSLIIETEREKNLRDELITLLTQQNTFKQNMLEEFNQRRNRLLSANHGQSLSWAPHPGFLWRLLGGLISIFRWAGGFTRISATGSPLRQALESPLNINTPLSNTVLETNNDPLFETVLFQNIMYTSPQRALQDIVNRIGKLKKDSTQITEILERTYALRLALEPITYLHLLEKIYKEAPVQALLFLHEHYDENNEILNPHEFVELHLMTEILIDRCVCPNNDSLDHLRNIAYILTLMSTGIFNEFFQAKHFTAAALLNTSIDPTAIPFENVSHLLHDFDGVILHKNQIYYVDQQNKSIEPIIETGSTKKEHDKLKDLLAGMSKDYYLIADHQTVALITAATGRYPQTHKNFSAALNDFYDSKKWDIIPALKKSVPSDPNRFDNYREKICTAFNALPINIVKGLLNYSGLLNKSPLSIHFARLATEQALIDYYNDDITERTQVQTKQKGTADADEKTTSRWNGFGCNESERDDEILTSRPLGEGYMTIRYLSKFILQSWGNQFPKKTVLEYGEKVSKNVHASTFFQSRHNNLVMSSFRDLEIHWVSPLIFDLKTGGIDQAIHTIFQKTPKRGALSPKEINWIIHRIQHYFPDAKIGRNLRNALSLENNRIKPLITIISEMGHDIDLVTNSALNSQLEKLTHYSKPIIARVIQRISEDCELTSNHPIIKKMNDILNSVTRPEQSTFTHLTRDPLIRNSIYRTVLKRQTSQIVNGATTAANDQREVDSSINKRSMSFCSLLEVSGT